MSRKRLCLGSRNFYARGLRQIAMLGERRIGWTSLQRRQRPFPATNQPGFLPFGAAGLPGVTVTVCCEPGLQGTAVKSAIRLKLERAACLWTPLEPRTPRLERRAGADMLF